MCTVPTYLDNGQCNNNDEQWPSYGLFRSHPLLLVFDRAIFLRLSWDDLAVKGSGQHSIAVVFIGIAALVHATFSME